MHLKKQIALFLLIFSFCSSLPQSDHSPEIIRLRKELVSWQKHHHTFCKIRNQSALTAVCSGIGIALGLLWKNFCTETLSSQHHLLDRTTAKYMVLPGMILAGVSYGVCTLSFPVMFASFIAALYSKYTVAEIKAMLHSLGYDIDENELQEIVEHAKQGEEPKASA